MELRDSSPKPVFSTSDCDSDPEEKEISDDDDRNHKHRRRETRSQSADTEALEPVLSRPFRKRNKPFENGRPYQEGDSHWSDTRFGKRRGMGSFNRTPSDSYQRMRPNQSLSGPAGPGRGRGRGSGSWGPCESRFSSIDMASQLVPPLLYTGRGLQNVSGGQSSPWNAFGMVPGIPNGGLPAMSMVIPRQMCRDFEERGFCLRGDMCPLEHGINRIVVEDVQSLSQFNLPVSLPIAPMMAPNTSQGSLPAIGPSSSSVTGKTLHSKSIHPLVIDGGLGMTDTFGGSSVAGGSDLYDPDQPLWSNDHPATSRALLDVKQSKIDGMGLLLNADSSDHNQVGLYDGCKLERLDRGAGAASGSQSVWGRISSSKNKFEPFSSTKGVTRHGKQTNVDTINPQMLESSSEPQIGSGRNMRNPSQKALRSLFIRGIPQKDNKPEALHSHFQKFGEVIDIYIPAKGEQAFVQFSKREEAEAALKAPDAVMGNRFIKLFWANRDSIMDDGVNGGSYFPRSETPSTVLPHLSVPHKRKDNLQTVAPKTAENGVVPVATSVLPKPVAKNGPKTTPPLQKKLGALELLKEEMRKKQEMLEQKRNEFRHKLDKLEKQAVGVKDEVVPDQAVKKPKGGGTSSNSGEVENSGPAEPSNAVSSPHSEATPFSSRSTENAEPGCSKSSSIVAAQEASNLKQSIRPLAPVGAPFILNRYKLDNRPTAFKILPPLPSGLANVDILKEHFSTFGDLPSVELEDLEPQDCNSGSEVQNTSARISFRSRRSAERAYLNGKCWQDQTLHFMWLQSSNSAKDLGVGENVTPTSKQPSDAGENVTPASKQPSVANGQSIANNCLGGSEEGSGAGSGEPEEQERRGDE
ncbi:putative trithorax group protein osa-like [Capsicum annuum]|uniref:zinc finger CCCH domain-containing protein 41 n=1 Tax=Capsicum annuum TaxID=4072 RepID=UPI001FB0BF9E|nr:zinc finger CCCH domain-containing protein 41 [Capsicum annuum]XP_047263571.1 zinc finger CCCH domain-containing protein 41 [Capsicum annuum]XP_047263572.1 zinc finger CCCH domain-containing protein 41 [Capsicum annuum]KAF3629302.1 putative trithorax group protein osa-like [Capsicum annuum]KAF3630513.1 putative trithorax group protein osa-like [Capsicum annuum]